MLLLVCKFPVQTKKLIIIQVLQYFGSLLFLLNIINLLNEYDFLISCPKV